MTGDDFPIKSKGSVGVAERLVFGLEVHASLGNFSAPFGECAVVCIVRREMS
jgi:hypothetical protein